MTPRDLAVAGSLVLTALVVLLACLAVATRPGRVATALDALAEAVGLPVDPEQRPALLRRMRTTRIGEAIGTGAGILLGLPFVAALASGAPERSWALLPLAGLVAGRATGRCVGGLLGRPVLLGTTGVGVRRRLVVGDYVGPVERTVPWVVAGLAAVAGPVPQLLTGTGGRAALAGAVALGALLAAEAASRAIVAGPQATADPGVLVWDDALRSTQLRGLATAVSVVGLVALLLVVPPALEAVLAGDGLVVAATALPVVVLLLLLGYAVRAVLRDPPRRYLRRLWPGLDPRGRPEPGR